VTEIFERQYKVPAADVNFMKHVDNQIYLRWMNEVAFAHSGACGWAQDDYANIGSGFVVKSHFIEYLAPTFENEELLFMSWLSDMSDRKSTRHYRFFKLPDYRLFMRAETKWVYVDLEKGRPMDIPNAVRDSFTIVSEEVFKVRLEVIKKAAANI